MNKHQKAVLDIAIERVLCSERVKITSFRKTDINFDGDCYEDPYIVRFYKGECVVLIDYFEVEMTVKGITLNKFRRDYGFYGLRILKNHGKLEEILEMSLL